MGKNDRTDITIEIVRKDGSEPTPGEILRLVKQLQEKIPSLRLKDVNVKKITPPEENNGQRTP